MFIPSLGQAAPERLTCDELDEVNALVYESIEQERFTPLARSLFYAYLAECQKDFAWQSHLKSGSFVGTFVPISLGVLRLFDPDANIEELDDKPIDPYSEALAHEILTKASERLERERQGIEKAPTRKDEGLWHPQGEAFGLNFASRLPWHLENLQELRSPIPNLSSKELNRQVEAVIKAMGALSRTKLVAIDYWAHQGDWRMIAEKYMRSHSIPIEIRLNVRALLYTALSDAEGAVFDSKYTYWAPRPHQVDPLIAPVLEAPNYPRYPSAHSALGKTAALILSHFFPKNRKQWEKMAEDSGLSRISAGLNFPIDHTQGKKLGESVAQAALKGKTLKSSRSR